MGKSLCCKVIFYAYMYCLLFESPFKLERPVSEHITPASLTGDALELAPA